LRPGFSKTGLPPLIPQLSGIDADGRLVLNGSDLAKAPAMLFDGSGKPITFSGNAVFHPCGAVQLGEEQEPFRIEAVYGTEGQLIGFIQIFGEAEVDEAHTGIYLRTANGDIALDANGEPIRGVTDATQIFDDRGYSVKVSTYVASGIQLKVIDEEGNVATKLYDEHGNEVRIVSFVQKIREDGTTDTVFLDANGNPVDITKLFDSSGRALGQDRFVVESAAEYYFQDDAGNRIAKMTDRFGNEISVSGMIQVRHVFDEHGRPVMQTVFSDANGLPVYLQGFSPPKVFDAEGRAIPQTIVSTAPGVHFAFGSLADRPIGGQYYDSKGKLIDLSYRSRVSLFQFCEFDGKLAQRKVVFDAKGREVGFMTLTFDRTPDGTQRPRIMFSAYPKDHRENEIQVRRNRLGTTMTPRFSGQLQPIPQICHHDEEPGNGIYDLNQMKVIARQTARKARPVGVGIKPLGDIGLAVKVVKPAATLQFAKTLKPRSPNGWGTPNIGDDL
jgi:hypothetical protein